MVGNVTLTVSGKLIDGIEFNGCDAIRVRMPGDLNMDGKVDLKDIVLAARAFGEFPGRPRWNPWRMRTKMALSTCGTLR
jgi:hypothetical protein